MNSYESVILINKNIGESNIESVITKFENFIKKNGNLIKVDKLGVKKLAYEVKKQEYAYYVVYEFKSKGDTILELERLYRITDEILKFITIRKDD